MFNCSMLRPSVLDRIPNFIKSHVLLFLSALSCVSLVFFFFFFNLFSFYKMFIWQHQVLVAHAGSSIFIAEYRSFFLVASMRDLVPSPGIEPRPSTLGSWES